MSGPIRPPLKVEEQDGTPSVRPVNTIKVTNGTLTDDGGAVVSVTTGTGGGGSMDDFDIGADTGTAETVSNGEEIKFLGGTGIDTAVAPTNAITTTLADTSVVAGSYTLTDITVDAQGRITAASSGSAGSPVGANPTGTVSGTASDGTAVTFMRSDAAPALADTAVGAGSYTNTDITVDAQGRITSAASGSGGGSGTVTVGTYAGSNNLAYFSGTTEISNTNNISISAVAGSADFYGTVEAGTLQTQGGGSAAAPAFTFGTDTDTGMFLTSAGILSLGTGGVEKLRISTSGLQAIPVGSASVPSISFATDTDTGLFHTGTNEIGFVTGGTERLAIGSSGELLVGGSAAGSDGQVLTSGGSGAAVAWEAAGGGGGTQYAIVPPDAQTGLSATYGNFSPSDRLCLQTTATTSTTSPDKLTLFPFTAPVSGTMGAITVRTGATNSTKDDISISIYSTDSDGLPATRMGVVDIDVNGGAALYSSALWDSSPTLTAGDTYFFGCVSSGAANPAMATRNLTGGGLGAVLGTLGFTHYAGTMYVALEYDTANTTPATIDPGTELVGKNLTMPVWTFVNT